MLQALLKSLGVYENSARLRQDLQFLVDSQRIGIRRKSVAIARLAIWSVVAALCASIAIVVAIIAVYISLRENFDSQVAIWTVFAGIAFLALGAGFVAWRSVDAIPKLPTIIVPEFYRPPEVDIEDSPAKSANGFAAQETFGEPLYSNATSLDASLKEWMIKTARQSAASISPDAVPVETLLKTVEPHVTAVASSALERVAEQLEKGSKSKIALILGSAALAGLLVSRTTK